MTGGGNMLTSHNANSRSLSNRAKHLAVCKVNTFSVKDYVYKWCYIYASFWVNLHMLAFHYTNQTAEILIIVCTSSQICYLLPKLLIFDFDNHLVGKSD